MYRPQRPKGMTVITRHKSVAVAMGTYNGEAFLLECLQSITRNDKGITIWASDDGSSDRTEDILRSFSKRMSNGNLVLLSGPKRGFSENYRSLINNKDIVADFYAFADQDDTWLPDKLDVAITWLESQPAVRPAMFCSRTRAVDRDGRHLRYSTLMRRKPSFGNALVESIASGNTMVFNRSAWELLRESATRTSFRYHDWWAYLIVAGSGGRVGYDFNPLVNYRQHDSNAVGLNNSIGARAKRIARLADGELRSAIESNIAALHTSMDLLTMESRRQLDVFERARSARFPKSSVLLRASGVYRQKRIDQIGLHAAAICGKL